MLFPEERRGEAQPAPLGHQARPGQGVQLSTFLQGHFRPDTLGRGPDCPAWAGLCCPLSTAALRGATQRRAVPRLLRPPVFPASSGLLPQAHCELPGPELPLFLFW